MRRSRGKERKVRNGKNCGKNCDGKNRRAHRFCCENRRAQGKSQACVKDDCRKVRYNEIRGKEVMDNIKSFELDHDKIVPGFYCLGENNNVYTYDMRFKKPNGGDYISYAALHSIEHLFAVVIRNSEIKDSVVYFGPMGCRTGCYLLLFGIEEEEAKKAVCDCLKKCLEAAEVYGATRKECGNYLEHDLEGAKKEIAAYLEILEK